MTANALGCASPFGLTAKEVGALERYVGDDWTVGPITIPTNLTGAQVSVAFFQNGRADAVATLMEGAGVTVATDRTTGVVTKFVVPHTITKDAPPQDRAALNWPTRAQVVVTDSSGLRRTWAVVLFLPLDARSDVKPILTPAP